MSLCKTGIKGPLDRVVLKLKHRKVICGLQLEVLQHCKLPLSVFTYQFRNVACSVYNYKLTVTFMCYFFLYRVVI